MEKNEILLKMIESHDKTVKACLDSYSGDHDNTVIPQSIHEYTEMFLIRVKDILNGHEIVF